MLTFLFGVHVGMVGAPESVRASATGSLDQLFLFTIGLLATALCAAECRAHGKPLPTNSLWVVLITWPISVPACLMWGYGRRGWYFALAGTFAFLFVAFLGLVLGAVLGTLLAR